MINLIILYAIRTFAKTFLDLKFRVIGKSFESSERRKKNQMFNLNSSIV